MATELGPSPSKQPETTPETTEENSNPELSLAPEYVDTRTPSRLASAMDRVATYFDQRAIDKDHARAIKLEPSEMARNYTDKLNEAMAIQRDLDHEDAIAMEPAEMQAKQDREEDTAYAANETFDEDTAFNMNKDFDKEARRQARRERLDNAKDRLFKFGRSAIKVAKTAGLIGVGLGIMGAEASAKGIQKGAEATASVASNAKEFTTIKVDQAKDKIQDTGETIGIAAILAGDAVRAKAAQARKAERAMRHAAIEKTKETAGRANTRRRKIGSGALAFLDRARASGQAATGAARGAWTTHGEQNKIR